MAGREDKKNVVWMFDSKTGKMSVDVTKSNKAELEARFSFKLEIYKDSDTHIESMKITNYKDGNENGSIVTSIVDLGQDIKDFKKFGVVIGDTYFRDLAREIEKEYSNIKVDKVIFSKSDPRYENLIDVIKQFFKDCREKESKESDFITVGTCNLPVNTFNGLAYDCGYSEYEIKNLRSQLAQDNYIRMVSGRYAILKRMGSKPERVIAFDREKLEVAIPEKQDKWKKAKDNGDE